MDQQHNSPVTLFYSYAHKDEVLRNELEKHLHLLQHRGLITAWHDRQIMPGADWAHTIDHHLNESSIILLLVSSDFLASDYCYNNEMQHALERHQRGEACVIPIIIRESAIFLEGATKVRMGYRDKRLLKSGLPSFMHPCLKWQTL